MPASKVAVARLHCLDGTTLNNQVVTLDAEGRVEDYTALSAEEAFTEWFKGDAYLR